MRGMHRRANRRGGFTLLEVLLVVVILGMLAALVVPNFMGTQAAQEVKIARQLVASGGALATQIDLFRMNMGRYPESLKELVEVPEDPVEKAKYGNEPYIKDANSLKDPWGNDIQYKQPGDMNKSSYDIFSWGPDKKEGGDDDIGNWSTDAAR